jgi:uncharacterized protein (DUF2062 family)
LPLEPTWTPYAPALIQTVHARSHQYQGTQVITFLGTLLHDPNLWHLNRHSVARAMAVGLFAAFIPIPLQMLVAAILAITVRGNMPIAISLVWLTNPITMPVFICTYMTGAWLMNVPPAACPMT